MLRAVLGPAELRAAAASPAELEHHPTLVDYVNRIMAFNKSGYLDGAPDGPTFATDLRPEPLAPAPGHRGGGWAADGSRDTGRGYTPRAGQRLCLAARAFWALRPSTELGVVSASHNSWLPPPRSVVAGDEDEDVVDYLDLGKPHNAPRIVSP